MWGAELSAVTGYKQIGSFGNNGTGGGYITSMYATDFGLVMKSSSGGSATTYFADYGYAATSGVKIAGVGGRWNVGSYCGAFFCACDYAAANTSTIAGASLSARPKQTAAK